MLHFEEDQHTHNAPLDLELIVGICFYKHILPTALKHIFYMNKRIYQDYDCKKMPASTM